MIYLTTKRVVKDWAAGRTITPAGPDASWTHNRYGRKFATQDYDENWFDAFAAFGLIPELVEPCFKIMTGHHYLDGAYTHTHKDTAPEGYVHVRCNTLLKKPNFGGMPHCGGQIMEVEKGDLWLVLASLEEHGSTPINGGERLLFSFGGLVPVEQIKAIIKSGGPPL